MLNSVFRNIYWKHFLLICNNLIALIISLFCNNYWVNLETVNVVYFKFIKEIWCNFEIIWFDLVSHEYLALINNLRIFFRRQNCKRHDQKTLLWLLLTKFIFPILSINSKMTYYLKKKKLFNLRSNNACKKRKVQAVNVNK